MTRAGEGSAPSDGAPQQAPPDSSPWATRGVLAAVWHHLVGGPVSRLQSARQQITPVEGLPALSLDALTSVAYGPEAIVVTLAPAGAAALHLTLPITAAIIGLLALLVVSYCQVIVAYPNGGGAYAVTRANFGRDVSLLAAAALVVDYTLTVAVSIAAGVGALASAFPALLSSTVPICLGVLALVTVFNLRGLGDAARAFLLPTIVFVVGLMAILVIGLVHPLALDEPLPGRSLLPTRNLEAVIVLLVLKAFSSGCSALTGVEAIANGVPLFKEPRVRRAIQTEVLLGVLLALMLAGIAVLVVRWHVGPRSGQTVLSTVMGIAVGRHALYYVVSLAITVVLALAANTSFGGLPVLASLLARDGYLPRLYALRDDRQVFATGIWSLAVVAGVLLVAVSGNTYRLIPLFAIGVFTGFTLSQSGLVVHWWRTRPRYWWARAALNGLGAVVTAVTTVIFVLTKFLSGAWVVVIAIPLLILLFRRNRAYYDRVGAELAVGSTPPSPACKPVRVIMPVSSIIGVTRLTEHALCQALSISPDVVVVSVAESGPEGDADAARLEQSWARWQPGVPLVVLRTDYASIVRPILGYIDEQRREDLQIVVLMPVLVPDHLRDEIMHNHVDVALSGALSRRPDLVVARAPMQLHEPRAADGETPGGGSPDRPASAPAADGQPTGTGRDGGPGTAPSAPPRPAG